MTGEQAERHPELAKRVAEEGHGVALHGYEHTREPPPEDFERGLQAVHGATGSGPVTSGPPTDG